MRADAVFAILIAALPASLQAATLDVTILDQQGRPVRDAVVSVSPTGKSGPAKALEAPVMRQQNIQFAPGTLVVPVGTTVSFPNFDKVRHHVYSFSKAKKFELKLYGRDQSRSVRFDAPGTVAVGCNIHDSMRGFIRVVDAPFAAKSDARGAVRFDNVPGGRVRLNIWHQGIRARENEVTQVVDLPASGRKAHSTRVPLGGAAR
jgi:plastocyanin